MAEFKPLNGCDPGINAAASARRCLILIMQYTYVLNTRGLKAGSVYELNRGYAFNSGVSLTTRVYSTM